MVRPHITLVRSRRPRRVSTEALEAGDKIIRRAPVECFLSVERFTLYSSTLTPTGPVYEKIASVPLKGVDSEQVFE